ncbi:MAG TPA: D-aminoacylase [Bryobacteraceae bacterium]|nr:D-aminoacylase [Bryobacteraceae bacterium]
MKTWLLFLLAATLPAADYDVIIRNARVVDGTGNPWFRADVAVKDGRIAAVGNLAGDSAARVIDARNHVLAPGFIDVHTHLERAIEKLPEADNFITDGVTTAITGNCGGSEVDLASFFARLEKLKLGLNLASFIGHNSVRSEVMGTANRQATPDEIARMQRLVAKNMQDGAVGFSTGLIYIPGTYANTDEVIALAKAAARYHGVYASHMRDEGLHVVEAIEEAVRVGRETGMPVELAHFKIDNKRLWGSSDKTIALVEKFRSEGVDVVVDEYPYNRSSTNLGITLPSWALADGREALKKRLADPATHAKIVQDMKDKMNELGQEDYSYATVASCDFDHALDGKTISEINVLKGRAKTMDNEIETILGLQSEGDLSMVYHSMGDQDVERIMAYPNTAFASDGWDIQFGKGVPHPRSYGTRARVLAEYVRERHILRLEDAIRKMTSLPARTFGFRDRGLVREGFWADLVLFDPATVQDEATFEKPHQFSKGFDLVMVNGAPVVEAGKPTGARPGRILRHQAQ